jgi:AcrR family transcriptional regulator
MSEKAGKVARIKEAMVALVGRQGYEATTLEQICAEASVSREDFERHFAGKQDCLEQAWERMTVDYICTCKGAYMAEDSWRDGLRAAGYAALDWLFADEARTRFFLIEVMAGLPRRDDGRVHRDARRGQEGGRQPGGIHPQHRRRPHRRGLRERDRLDQSPRGAE